MRRSIKVIPVLMVSTLLLASEAQAQEIRSNTASEAPSYASQLLARALGSDGEVRQSVLRYDLVNLLNLVKAGLGDTVNTVLDQRRNLRTLQDEAEEVISSKQERINELLAATGSDDDEADDDEEGDLRIAPETLTERLIRVRTARAAQALEQTSEREAEALERLRSQGQQELEQIVVRQPRLTPIDAAEVAESIIEARARQLLERTRVPALNTGNTEAEEAEETEEHISSVISSLVERNACVVENIPVFRHLTRAQQEQVRSAAAAACQAIERSQVERSQIERQLQARGGAFHSLPR